ncbi:hypothetical protein Hanom_Chr01g00079791 [Helianthus anomalus]
MQLSNHSNNYYCIFVVVYLIASTLYCFIKFKSTYKRDNRNTDIYKNSIRLQI